MVYNAKQRINTAINNDNLSVETIRNGLFVGNTHGLAYARRAMELEEVNNRITALEIAVNDLKSDNNNLKSDNNDLKSDNKLLYERINELELSTKGFSTLRSRFISTYKRDKLGNATDADYRIIGEGNSWAHTGNALRDAELYGAPGGRMDFGTYESLYGLHPGVVTMITYSPTIRVLNQHATVIASSRSTGTPRFYQLFAEFIAALKESDFASGFLQDKPTKATAAYWSFLNCIKQEVDISKPT